MDMLVAPSLPPRGRRNIARRLGSVALVLGGVLAFLLILQNFRQGAPPRLSLSGSASAPAPATRVKLERLTRSYLDALGHGDYARALACTVTQFRRRQTPTRFASLVQSQYRPTTRVQAVRRWQARVTFDGREAEAIMMLQCHDGLVYETAMDFERQGDLWRISNVLPPIPAVHAGLPMRSLPMR